MQLRLYSRDDTLSSTSHLSSVQLPAPIHLVCLHDNSLLIYTTANTFYHFLIIPTEREVELRLCGSISFEGVVQVPGRVRAMSWLIPLAQKSASLFTHRVAAEVLTMKRFQSLEIPRTTFLSPPSSSSLTPPSSCCDLAKLPPTTPIDGRTRCVQARHPLQFTSGPTPFDLWNPRRSSTTFKFWPIESKRTGRI